MVILSRLKPESPRFPAIWRGDFYSKARDVWTREAGAEAADSKASVKSLVD